MTLKNLKFVNIIAILVSLCMLYLTVGVFLNSSLDAKYGVSQKDIEYAMIFSKILLGYIVFIIAIVIMNLIYFKKLNSLGR